MSKDELTIIKVGGKVVEEPEALQVFLNDFSALQGAKLLVHGGGRSATALAARMGLETQMVQGRRVTDASMLEVVTMVYGGLVNKSVVAGLQALRVNALGLTGADLNLVLAHKRTGAAIDYGFVGDVDSVQAGLLKDLIQKGVVPVVAPLTHDGAGQLLNTNADTMASALAVALSSEFKLRLVYCFEKPGVLSDPDNDESVIPRLSYALFQKYLQEGVISEGMIPKLDNGFSALKNGVSEVIITNTKGLARVGSGTALEL